MEVVKKGIGASPGIAIAQAVVLNGEPERVHRGYVSSDRVAEEVVRLGEAFASAKREVQELLETQKDAKPEIHRIIQTHLVFLEDEEIRSDVTHGIENDGFTAEYAVARVMGRYVKAFEQMKDDTLSSRFSDLRDVEKRLLRNLGRGQGEDLSRIAEPSVLVARDLTPSQTAVLDTSMVRGFATEVGGTTSHTAIVARSLGIPAVVGVGSLLERVSAGDTLILDGHEGRVLVDPGEETLRDYREKSRSLGLYEAHLAEESALDTVSTDGVEFKVLGNIEFPWEVKHLQRNHADGVGLFRTEFLYLNSLGRAADEETHVASYLSVVNECAGRPVTIRTLDMGSDKMPEDANLEAEPNPALGARSLRFSRARQDLFAVQLRAILRVSHEASVRVMFPMVSSLEELSFARESLQRAKEELRSQGVPFDDELPVGIMIEVPSAALLAEELAREVDFFSIGSNDLIQYTLAVDRVNERVAEYYQPAHPAVLRLLRTVLETGRRSGIEVSLCGEMASDKELAVLLAGLGLTSFSVTPGAIPKLKRVLRSISVEDATRVAKDALALTRTDEILGLLRREVTKLIPDPEL